MSGCGGSGYSTWYGWDCTCQSHRYPWRSTYEYSRVNILPGYLASVELMPGCSRGHGSLTSTACAESDDGNGAVGDLPEHPLGLFTIITHSTRTSGVTAPLVTCSWAVCMSTPNEEWARDVCIPLAHYSWCDSIRAHCMSSPGPDTTRARCKLAQLYRSR